MDRWYKQVDKSVHRLNGGNSFEKWGNAEIAFLESIKNQSKGLDGRDIFMHFATTTSKNLPLSLETQSSQQKLKKLFSY